MIEIKEVGGGSHTYVQITATTQAELINAVSKYERQFPYAGYATRVVFEGWTSGGLYLAKLERYSFCD